MSQILRIPLKYSDLFQTIPNDSVGKIMKNVFGGKEKLNQTESIYYNLIVTDINNIQEKVKGGKKGGEHGIKGGRPLDVWENEDKPLRSEKNNPDIRLDKIKQDKTNKEKMFLEFWNLYPLKKGKQKAESKYAEVIKSGIKHEKIVDSIKNYIKENEMLKRLNQFCPGYKHPATRLSQGCWDDEHKTKATDLLERKNVSLKPKKPETFSNVKPMTEEQKKKVKLDMKLMKSKIVLK